MTEVYKRALAFVLRWEGGYSNHPNDTGGKTNFGITHAVYDQWRVSQGLPTRSVKQIETSEVEAIYETRYWDRADCADFTAYDGLSLVHFDTAVNMGTVRAAKTLQEAVGAKPDGKIGPKTHLAVKTACDLSTEAVLKKYCDVRERVYRWIAANQEGSDVFLTGWMNRLNAARVEIGVLERAEVAVVEIVDAVPMGRLADIELGEDLEGFDAGNLS